MSITYKFLFSGHTTIGDYMKKYKDLIISIAIPLVIGGISFLCTMNSQGIYQELLLPKYAPSSSIFPIVWTVLYILMGIASYLIYRSNHDDRNKVLWIYGIQLAVNFVWPLLFFNLQSFLLATVCLLVLWAIVFIMLFNFFRIRSLAGYLIVPYILWISFALYLNFNIFLLN